MTLGAAASNPASKGPRRPPVFITLFSAHAADPSPGRLARCQRCPLYGAERHAASLRPAAPAGATRPPRCLKCMRTRGAVLATGTRGPAAMLCRTRRGRRGPQRIRKVRGKSAAAPPGPPAGPSPSLQTQNAIVLLCCGESNSALQRSREATKYVSPGTRAQVSVASSGPERICVAQVPLRGQPMREIQGRGNRPGKTPGHQRRQGPERAVTRAAMR
jgi:hypothetical protein